MSTAFKTADLDLSIRINAEKIRRQKSQPEYHSNINDELDGIFAMETYEITMSTAPDRIPVSYKNMSPSEQPLPCNRTIWQRIKIGILNDKPDQKSPIFMQNDYEEEPVLDEFGAELWTFSSRGKDGIEYNQHFFVNVKTDGPAAKMKIHAYDEIVLLNTVFVPNLTHTGVLNLFHKVKIDGKTRFKLIIRRVVNNKSKKQWEWIETSAILAPDFFQKEDNYPIVEEPKFKKLPGDIYEVRTFHFYKIPGTQYYLDVKNESVVADVMTNTVADKSKRICKILRYSLGSDGMLNFTAALCTTPKMRYIVVGNGNQIKLDENPLWFEISCIGNKIKLKTNDMYMTCNSETLKIEVGHSEYMFDELPADEGLDHPDSSEYVLDEVPADEGLDHPDRSEYLFDVVPADEGLDYPDRSEYLLDEIHADEGLDHPDSSEYVLDEVPADEGLDHPDRPEYLFDVVPADEGLNHPDSYTQRDEASLSCNTSLPLSRNNSRHLSSALDGISTLISIPHSQKILTFIVPVNDDTGAKRKSCFRDTPSFTPDHISDRGSQEDENLKSDKNRINGFHSSANGMNGITDSVQWFTDIEMDCPVGENGYTRGSEILKTHTAQVKVF